MDNDFMPNDSTFFVPEVPEITQQANTDELVKTAQALPVIEDLIAWFEGAIEATDSNKAMREDAKSRGVSIEVASTAYEIVRELLEVKKQEFESLQLNIKQ